MSKASDTFAESITDSENLLQHFNALNTRPPPPELEVLKRAGLVMAMTAWETYVEDRLEEACSERLAELTDRSVAEFVECKLSKEIKQLHNPNSHKTIELFHDYAGVDLSASWSWNHYEYDLVRERLDSYIKLRGDVVHRSRPASQGKSSHAVNKSDLKKAISFLKNLVKATERALEGNRWAAPSKPIAAAE